MLGGCGGIDELLEYLDEAVGVVVEGKVPGPGEDLQSGAGHRGMRHSSMADRNHRILFTPDQLHRNRFGQITPIQHGDDLPAPVHYRAQGPGEGR